MNVSNSMNDKPIKSKKMYNQTTSKGVLFLFMLLDGLLHLFLDYNIVNYKKKKVEGK